MTDLQAASNTRLLGSNLSPITEPTWDWSRDWQRIASRTLEFVSNDPFAAAMVQCKLDTTHGPDGLRPVSLAQLDRTKPVSKADHDVRQTLERGFLSAAGVYFDAAGQLTRKAFDRQLDWLATVMGEAFAIRSLKFGRPRSSFATCWRLVRMERVSNPKGVANNPHLYHGFKLDDDGAPVGLWVETTRNHGLFTSMSDRTWEYVEWYNPDGTPNVVHRVGWKMPGSLRGISMFTPMLLLARQLGGTIEAHVTAKRAQACNPVIYYVRDPIAAAAKAKADASSVIGPHTKFNPLQVYFAELGSEVKFTETHFNGADLEAFLKIGFRVLCSVWQMPVEVVLCQMGESSLASARAGLDQVDRTAEGWRVDHIEQASQSFEQATAAEMVFTGEITPGPSGLPGLCLTRYRKPPKYSTDRKKDAETIKLLTENNVSPTTALGQFGYDYEDEIDQSVRDRLYREQAEAAAKIVPPGDDILRDAQASVALIAAGLSNWQIEIAKRGQQYGAVWEQLMTERKQAAEMGLVLDLSGTNAPSPDSTVRKEEPKEDNANADENAGRADSARPDEDDSAKSAKVANP